jgi:hypothetical protein
MSKPEHASKSNDMDTIQREIEEDARQFILDGIDAEVPPMQLLDELASFYDGDLFELF